MPPPPDAPTSDAPRADRAHAADAADAADAVDAVQPAQPGPPGDSDLPADSPLVAANRAVHRALDALNEDVFLALMGADLAAARAAWHTLGRALDAHQAVEEPALAAHPSPDPPRGGSPDLILAEHQRLNLLWGQGLTLLDELAQLASSHPEDLPRAIVRALDRLLRLHHLLDHHGEREHRVVYPDLEARLAPEDALALADALRAAAAPFTPDPSAPCPLSRPTSRPSS